LTFLQILQFLRGFWYKPVTLRTEYPHLSVVHLLKNGCHSSEEVRIIQSFKTLSSILFVENTLSKHKTLDATRNETHFHLPPPHHHLDPHSLCAAAKRPNYKDQSLRVNKIKKINPIER
jgi:hypothetical protein